MLVFERVILSGNLFSFLVLIVNTKMLIVKSSRVCARASENENKLKDEKLLVAIPSTNKIYTIATCWVSSYSRLHFSFFVNRIYYRFAGIPFGVGCGGDVAGKSFDFFFHLENKGRSSRKFPEHKSSINKESEDANGPRPIRRVSVNNIKSYFRSSRGFSPRGK